MNNIAMAVANYGMGKGDHALQFKLIGNYLELIWQNESLPDVICLYTDGVKLMVEGLPKGN
jgi:hypothetical protein